MGTGLVDIQASCLVVLKCDDEIVILTQQSCDLRTPLIAARSQTTFGGEPNTTAISAKSAS
jgi:hypothetical protein